MTRRSALAAVTLLAALSAPAASQAQGARGDSVTGSGTSTSYSFVFDAHSGPSGENPTGTARIWFTNTPSVFTSGPVTCLAVEGNRAIVGIENGPGSFMEGEGNLIYTSDDPDRFFFRIWFEPPTTCPADAFVGETPDPLSSGDIAITDGNPPTSNDQCRGGGWSTYGIFKNQGACISSVQSVARGKCVFERAAHGILAFRAKYGVGPNHDRAMRRCVRQYTGS